MLMSDTYYPLPDPLITISLEDLLPLAPAPQAAPDEVQPGEVRVISI